MGMRTLEDQTVRTITQNSTGTYAVSLPIEEIRRLGWRKGQKIIIKRRGNKLIIEDWQSK